MDRPFRAVVLGLAGFVLIGSAPALAYQGGVVKRGGTLTGTVHLQGPIPKPYVIHVTKNASVFGRTVPDERLLISKEGRLKNVVITVEGIQQGKSWPPSRPRLVNRGGRFIPHVQVARQGSSLQIVNRDPVLHNTHGFQGGRSMFNVALPRYRRDRPVLQPLAEAGVLEVMCDVHDWMNGWVVVLAHPYFAVTGKDGTYSITHIPPGTYTVTAWHEKLGKQEGQIAIPSQGKARLDFALPASATP